MPIGGSFNHECMESDSRLESYSEDDRSCLHSLSVSCVACLLPQQASS